MRRSIWNWLFLAASFGLAFLFMVLIGQEAFPEWKGYQARYYRRLADLTGDPGKAATALAVKQVHLPELGKVDRCMTCHLGIDNPRMKDEPQPFTVHPDLGIPGFLAKHPFNEMGCTVCHHGQGPATTVAHAHGPVKHWEEPLLNKGLTVGTCATCHENVQTVRGAQVLNQAQQKFVQLGCIGCHTLKGSGMLVGPELAETWAKSTAELDFRYIQGEHTVANWVYEHFLEPQRVVPGYPALGIPETAMPNYELTEEEAMHLTALVLSFSASETVVPHKFKVGAGPAARAATYASPVERGRTLFVQYGCAGCHGPEGRGGIRNKNMEPAEEVPPLVYVAGGFTRQELIDTIANGRYPARADASDLAPPLWMPSWKEKISEEELEALADYLMSLSPEG